MIRDPFYRDIVAGLSGHLDHEVFEQCVQDLLREEFPSLVPVRGGSDGGMDGAISDKQGDPFPLICTTAENYSANLTKNLQSYAKHGKNRRAVFVTSHEVSGENRIKLQEKANKQGFTLVHICDQAGIANLLHRHPEWCKELLNLTGTAPPLSLLPLTKRSLGEQPISGRESDLEWLMQTSGDLVLSGQPGSGKTYLMYTFARIEEGLFVTSNDRTEISNGIRSQKPAALLVDDAHVHPELLVVLRQLREEVGADFRIIANCWAGSEDEIRAALDVSGQSVRSLPLLPRENILTIIRACGIAGPDILLNELLDQAEGRPGLAVTLCRLVLRGDVQDIALGDALARDISTTFESLVGERAVHVLAAFAVGGDAGMTMQEVAKYMELSRIDILNIVTQLAAGGVLLEGRETLSVRPPPLRHALVRDTFFKNSATSLPIQPLLECVPSVSDTVSTLVRAKGRGARIDDTMLRSLVEKTHMSEAWCDYARLGREECKWIIEAHPEMIGRVARIALYHYPEGALSLVLNRAVGDDRPLNSHPDHSLRLIEDWIESTKPGTDEIMKARTALLESTVQWAENGGNENVALKALALSLSPGYNFSHPVPGSGLQFTFGIGCVDPGDVKKIAANWSRILAFLKKKQPENWQPITSMIEDYIFRRHAISGRVPKGSSEAMQEFGWKMLEDLIAAAPDRPGILHWAKHTAYRDERELSVDLDPDFAAIYPPDEDRFLDDEAEKEASKAVREVAERWAQEDPVDTVKKYGMFRREIEPYNCYPRFDDYLFAQIALSAKNPQKWVDALLDADMHGGLVYPFLKKLTESEDSQAQETVLRCLEKQQTQHTTLQLVVAMHNPPEALLSVALKLVAEIPQFPQTVEFMAMGNRIPEENLRLLLRHSDDGVAEAAAIGEWYAEPRHGVRDSLLDDWRSAIIRGKDKQRALHEIFEAMPDIARAWLEYQLRNATEFDFDLHSRDTAEDAMRVLNEEQRLELLNNVPPDRWWDDMIREIVGKNEKLYEILLGNGELKKHHLAPLRGHPKGKWITLALMALDAGYEPGYLVGATRSGVWSWSGNESPLWDSWIEDFTQLQSHHDPRLQEVGRIGMEYATEHQNRALEEEHREAVYGIK